MESKKHRTSQSTQNTKDGTPSPISREENIAYFKRALAEAMDRKREKAEEEVKDIEIPPPSKRHKIRMNRIFRERVGGSYIPYPEVDCLFERARSRIVKIFKINELIDRRKERKRDK